MFKRTFSKLNVNNFSSSKSANNRLDLFDTISEIKKQGKTVFGAIYSNNKRHTVYKSVEASDYEKSLKRRNTYDYMNNFTTSILPKIESFVEKRLLEKFKMNLNNNEKSMIEDVYRMRRHIANVKISEFANQNLKIMESNEASAVDHIDNIFSSSNGDGFKYHDFDNIGKYVSFPSIKRKEYFPFGCYGEYMKNEFEKTKIFSIMCREESLKLASAFSHVKTHKERLQMIDFEAVLNKNYNFKEELKNFESFSLFYQEISYSLLKHLEYLKKYDYKYIFINPEIFDSLVTVLVRNLKFSPFNVFLICPISRKKIIEETVDLIYQHFKTNFNYNSKDVVMTEARVSQEDFYPLTRFVDIIEKFKVFKYELDYKDIFEFAEKAGIELDKRVYENKTKETKVEFKINLASYWESHQYQWRPEESREQLPKWKGFNTGVLLTGEGNGKSMILAYLHAWAKESGWFVFPVNDVNKYTQHGYPIERHISGLYFQPELAVELLKDIKIVNYKILKETAVDLNDYGKFNIAGHYDDDPEPNLVMWDHRSQTYTDSWKEHNFTPEEEIIAEDHPDHQTTRLGSLLPNPKTLLEIVNAGIENERLATCAVAELHNLLAKSESLKTMIIVDNYNELFKPTCYDSYKYANFKDYDVKIPPHDISLCRLFMKFDSHFFKQGVKVCAISLKAYNRHKFTAEMINFPKGYDYKVENLRLDDFRIAMQYYMRTNFIRPQNDIEIQDTWQLCQGNWKHFLHDMKIHYRMLPTQANWLQRKEKKRIIKESKKF